MQLPPRARWLVCVIIGVAIVHTCVAIEIDTSPRGQPATTQPVAESGDSGNTEAEDTAQAATDVTAPSRDDPHSKNHDLPPGPHYIPRIVVSVLLGGLVVVLIVSLGGHWMVRRRRRQLLMATPMVVPPSPPTTLAARQVQNAHAAEPYPFNYAND